MVNPLIYDFKRTFFRLSVLIFLILFIAGGIGIIYVSYHSIVVNPADLYNYNVIVTVSQDNGEYHIVGFAFDNNGNPLSGVTIEINNNTYITNSSGYIVANTSILPSSITSNYNGEKKVLLSFSSTIFFNITKLVDFSEFYPFTLLVIAGYNGNSAHFIFAGNGNFSVGFKSLNGSIIKTVNLSVNGIKDYVIEIPPHASYVYIENGLFIEKLLPLMPELEAEIIAPMLGSVGLFLFAFNIIFIYIAYVMFGKLKERGLDFILSRPITRGQLYFTRYFSGVLSMIVADFLFILTISLTSFYLIHFIPSFIVYYMFIYVFVTIAVWYSISYLFYTIMSPGSGLGISIALYFVIDIVISIISLLYPSFSNVVNYYINPSSVSSLLSYYMLYLQFPQGVNLGISIITQLLWIILPVMGGYIIFKRINI